MTTAMPPVGPLTSTENLLPGDILRTIEDYCSATAGIDSSRPRTGAIVEVASVADSYHLHIVGFPAKCAQTRFAFVARPGVWMPWSGGENPVPGMQVQVRFRANDETDVNTDRSCRCDRLRWRHFNTPGDIVEYMVVAEPSRDAEQPRKIIQFDPFTGKDGDHVRVSFTATLGPVAGVDGIASHSILSNLKSKYPDLVVELLDRPFAVGDQVVIMGGSRGKILAFTSDGRAVCEYDAGDITGVVARDLSCLTRV